MEQTMAICRVTTPAFVSHSPVIASGPRLMWWNATSPNRHAIQPVQSIYANNASICTSSKVRHSICQGILDQKGMGIGSTSSEGASQGVCLTKFNSKANLGVVVRVPNLEGFLDRTQRQASFITILSIIPKLSGSTSVRTPARMIF